MAIITIDKVVLIVVVTAIVIVLAYVFRFGYGFRKKETAAESTGGQQAHSGPSNAIPS
jgi:hypothetical protein